MSLIANAAAALVSTSTASCIGAVGPLHSEHLAFVPVLCDQEIGGREPVDRGSARIQDGDEHRLVAALCTQYGPGRVQHDGHGCQQAKR